MLAFGVCLAASAAQSNSLVWRTNGISADVRNFPLPELLKQIATQTGWRVFVEPDTARNASVKFKNESSGTALKMLLGDLNFALVPKTNSPSELYVFRTRMENATRLVRGINANAKHVANELLVKVKPGTDIDALAKSLGAKITGRNDKLGIYRLEFSDANATDSALAQLQNNSDVQAVDYNYIYEPPPSAQQLASASMGPVSLKLNPPGDSGRPIVGLVDTSVQSLGDQLNQFLLKQLSVAGDSSASGDGLNHGTAMAETILRAMGIAGQGGTSAQILPVDVYGSSGTTTSWYVALGIQAAVDGGANIVNLSLGGTGDSSILSSLIAQGESQGIVFIASAGNEPVATPTYPAAYPGVLAVTAEEHGQLAPYANYGSFVNAAAPDSSIVYLGTTPWLVQGTSVSAAYMTGVAAGTQSATGQTWAQILAALQKSFPVPANPSSQK
ncbi:MAG TPA: S8 family serine peptidase [Verrucomicrobiae bacterium]|nr:S8 family serine peptidase [Verrucomicrobiae bacterium]